MAEQKSKMTGKIKWCQKIKKWLTKIIDIKGKNG
jgi:hypothetical protein